MDTARKRLFFTLLLCTMVLGLNTLAVVPGNADGFYGRISVQSESHRNAGDGI